MKIKLGKLPNEKKVRLTIFVSNALKNKLDRYANLHSETWNDRVMTPQLIPEILAMFLKADRVFQRAERETEIESNRKDG